MKQPDEDFSPPSPQETAREAGLRYVSDARPGFRREKSGEEWTYFDASGDRVAAEEHLARIRKLAIPPAWERVWICPQANGHLQATGIDARKRKQYRYHEGWRAARDSSKYGRVMAFGRALPSIRKRTEADLGLSGMPRAKVLAAVVRLLETTLIRVGNDQYAKENNSYGLTTMLNRHAKVNGSSVRFKFKGKSGVKHEIDVNDRRLARMVRKCQELPGQEIFAYIDEQGVVKDVTSQDVNDYLHEIAGDEFSAKDFRTWAGTILAALALREFEPFTTGREAKKNITAAVESVARTLGNTPAVCRKCYVHPVVLDSYMDGATISVLQQEAEHVLAERLHSLKPEEAAVMTLLQQRLASATEHGPEGTRARNLSSPHKRLRKGKP